MSTVTPGLSLQAIFLKAHLKMLAAGLKNSKYSGKTLLELASRHTGKQYKRGNYIQAIRDLEQLPIVIHT